MISGEYVVLEGAEALVAAVDARVAVRLSPPETDGSAPLSPASPEPGSLPPEVVLTRQLVEARFGAACTAAAPMELTLDTHALRRGDAKLGLGSSAAASAACAAALLAHHGRDVAASRPEVLAWALAGHRAVAPQGSGADVAASTLGGLVRFRRDEAERAVSVAWPQGLEVVVTWTGKPARTSDLVARVRGLAEQAPGHYEAAVAPLRAAAEAMRCGMLEGELERVVRAAAEHGRAMAGLGEAAGAPIVTPELERLAAVAEAEGGGAKPSGAGGGDVGLAFFADAGDAARFRRRCRDEGLVVLPLAMAVEGVRRDDGNERG
jgi:phosphomevalonate kinase